MFTWKKLKNSPWNISRGWTESPPCGGLPRLPRPPRLGGFLFFFFTRNAQIVGSICNSISFNLMISKLMFFLDCFPGGCILSDYSGYNFTYHWHIWIYLAKLLSIFSSSRIIQAIVWTDEWGLILSLGLRGCFIFPMESQPTGGSIVIGIAIAFYCLNPSNYSFLGGLLTMSWTFSSSEATRCFSMKEYFEARSTPTLCMVI